MTAITITLALTFMILVIMSTPSVGIFWSVPDASRSMLSRSISRLSPRLSPMAILTHPRGYYEVWEAWRPLTPAAPPLRLARF